MENYNRNGLSDTEFSADDITAYNKQMREGNYFIRDKNWKNGEKCFSEALKINYNSYEANLGKLFCKLKISSFAEKSKINNVTKLKEFANTYNSANNTDKIYLLQWAEENSKFVRKKRLKICFTTISCFVVTIALALATFLVIIPGIYYNKAVNAIEQKRYYTAYLNIADLNKYRDTTELIKKFELLQIKNAEVGDDLIIGDREYYKASWLVIAKEDNKILLLSTYISNYGVNSFPEGLANEEDNDVDYIGGWEKSGIRKELNGHFFDTVFSDAMKSRILTNNLVDSDCAEDKIFILSEDELNKYLPSKDSRSSNHKYILRNVEDDFYSIVETDGSISKYKFTYLSVIDGRDFFDGKVKFSDYQDYLQKYKNEINNNIYIKNACYKAAMWVDISDIDL